MRKFLIGVIVICLLFSCKKSGKVLQDPILPLKDSITPPPPPPPPPPIIDSFLLHPPPMKDSLPIAFTKGTWWKYQRTDSSKRMFNPTTVMEKNIDSSIELITVIGRSHVIEMVSGYKNNILRYRYDTVESVLLEVKNLTKNKIDTINAFYYNTRFYITPHKDSFQLSITLPQVEITKDSTGPNNFYRYQLSVNKNKSISIFNTNFNNCIFTSESHFSSSNTGSNWDNLNIYFKPNIGFVYWNWVEGWSAKYGLSGDTYYYRRLIDYHIEP